MTIEKVMFSSDQQIPHCDWRMINLWFKVMKSFKPDRIVYAGDWTDNTGLGRWVDGGTQEFLNNISQIDINDENVILEMYAQEKPVREMFERTRELCPDAYVLCAGGNHDLTRVTKYFDQKRPEVLEFLTPETLWGFKTLGFDYIDYEDRPKFFAGDVYVHHGVAISQYAGESVRKDTEKFGVSIIRGHSHRQSIIHTDYPLINKTISGYEIGHMMDINCSGASYDNIHNWHPGFAVGYIESGATDTTDGQRLHVDLIPISRDYTCIVGGKIFKA